MRKQIKRLLVGIVGAFAVFWAYTAHAWDWNADQRGYIDRMVWNVGFVVGPSTAVTIDGWACMHPKYNSAWASTNVEVYQYINSPSWPGWQRLYPAYAYSVSRPDVVNYGACANLNNGFKLGINPVPFSQNGTTYFLVRYNGTYGSIFLEGPSQATIVY